MGSGWVQVLQAVSLTAVAAGIHVAFHRASGRFTAHLEEIAGGVMRSIARISELLCAVLYLAFIAATQPVGGGGPVAAQIESLLDTIALFALLAVITELFRLTTLHRVAEALEPWPPQVVEGATA